MKSGRSATTKPATLRQSLTNAFSKKIENHTAAVAIHFAYYNLCRPHKTLSKPYPTTPAMAAGVEDHIWTLEELVGLLDYLEKLNKSN